MTVACDVAIAMIDVEGESVTVTITSCGDNAGSHGNDVRPSCGRGEIDAGMPGQLAGERIGTTSERGRDPALSHGTPRDGGLIGKLPFGHQAFQDFQLLGAIRDLRLQLADGVDERRWGIGHRVLGQRAANAGLGIEVELACIQPGHGRDAFAQCLHAQQPGLQARQSHGEGFELCLGLLLQAGQGIGTALQFLIEFEGGFEGVFLWLVRDSQLVTEITKSDGGTQNADGQQPLQPTAEDQCTSVTMALVNEDDFHCRGVL